MKDKSKIRMAIDIPITIIMKKAFIELIKKHEEEEKQRERDTNKLIKQLKRDISHLEGKINRISRWIE